MGLTILFFCLTLGLTQASLGRTPLEIAADGTPEPTDCTQELWNNEKTGSFRPHTATPERPANCSRFWRCNNPEEGQEDFGAKLFECPPCPQDRPECQGKPLLVFDITTSSCQFPSRVTEFFVLGECNCACNCDTTGTNGNPCNPFPDTWDVDFFNWCLYCNEDKECKPGCLEDSQCADGLVCRNHTCITPLNKCVDPFTPSPPTPECDCNDAEACDVCSTCEATVTWSCSPTVECCVDKPCAPCFDCIDGKCEPKECGVCTACNNTTQTCEPMDCPFCSICKDDTCVDFNPCDPCEDCINGECVPRDCGDCHKCNNTTNTCEPMECPFCSICKDDTCVDFNPCGPCEDCINNECVPRDCGDCHTCNVVLIDLLNNKTEDKCIPMECSFCEICKNDTCVPFNPCGPCQYCDGEKCVDIDCGPCGTCNYETSECEANQNQCNPNCGEPDCETCVGVPGKNLFECQHICADDDEGCCCVDDDCKDYCEEGQVPMCTCEEDGEKEKNTCQCMDVGHIVVDKIKICTEECDGCGDNDTGNMILNLIGEEFRWGHPECKTAELEIPLGKDQCLYIGEEADAGICGGCWKYPLGGDIDEDSTINWKGTGTWSGSFCVMWQPQDRMYVKCVVKDGEVEDCDEVCNCEDGIDERKMCPNMKSSKSKNNSGILGLFN